MKQKEFLETQAFWYAKLKETGFRDIEPSERLGKNSFMADHWIETKKRVWRGVETGKAELFRLATQWIDKPIWRTRTERWAWAAWTTGFDFHEITKRWPQLGSPGALAGRVRTQVGRMLRWFREEAAENAEVEGR